MYKFFCTILLILSFHYHAPARQPATQPKGNLFIIGGGKRTAALMQSMLSTAHLKPSDYIVVLPMATAEPDTALYYFAQSLQSLCNNHIVSFNFTAATVNRQSWLDSLQHARLIYIAGGDQSRFMQVVVNTPVFTAIHTAYEQGATIAGTSAGAAVMSREMITGKELLGDTTYNATFKKLQDKNLELRPGLGLIDHVIIDQHFIVRSRYNRLLSAIARFPSYVCIGIDEATAIIVHNNQATVTGDSQVIVFRDPQQLSTTRAGLIKFSDIKMSIYTQGDTFRLKIGGK